MTKKVRCPYCGKNVTKGIKKWRTQTAVAAKYFRRLEKEIRWIVERVEAKNLSRLTTPEFDYAECEGLRLAASLARTELNRQLYCHHSHIDFVVRERDMGRIPKWLTI